MDLPNIVAYCGIGKFLPHFALDAFRGEAATFSIIYIHIIY